MIFIITFAVLTTIVLLLGLLSMAAGEKFSKKYSHASKVGTIAGYVVDGSTTRTLAAKVDWTIDGLFS